MFPAGGSGVAGVLGAGAGVLTSALPALPSGPPEGGWDTWCR